MREDEQKVAISQPLRGGETKIKARPANESQVHFLRIRGKEEEGMCWRVLSGPLFIIMLCMLMHLTNSSWSGCNRSNHIPHV